jgi:hypothetical protein
VNTYTTISIKTAERDPNVREDDETGDPVAARYISAYVLFLGVSASSYTYILGSNGPVDLALPVATCIACILAVTRDVVSLVNNLLLWASHLEPYPWGMDHIEEYRIVLDMLECSCQQA